MKKRDSAEGGGSAPTRPRGSLTYEFGAFRLDPVERMLVREGRVLPLTPKAFDLLVILVEHHGRLIDKQALITELWPDTIVEEANLAYNVSALRKVLDDGAAGPSMIQTVPTKGYRFVAPVTTSPPWPAQNEAPGALVRLGPYHIISTIGAGAMGQVYKARDLRLDRTVAIKVLSPELTGHAGARQRFEREAQVVAALSHPHICPLFDVGHQDGTDFLVMEYVDGETLASRLSRGKLPIDQVLEYGIQIADALSAAHKASIIHRDLKPGNIMLTRRGAKLLDFGLAKMRPQPGDVGLAETAIQPPISSVGVIVGTVPYMAPEQLEGKEADAKTDIFAFGAVLYEMITGKRTFEGSSQATLIANILNAEPTPLPSLEPATPAALVSLVRSCLAKDPEKRWGSIYDVLLQLTWIRAQPALEPAVAPVRVRIRYATSVLVLVLVLVVAVAAVWVITRIAPPSRARHSASVHTLLDVRPAEQLHGGRLADPERQAPGGSRAAFAWTPDGRALVFVGVTGERQLLYLRSLDRDEAQPLVGTDGARGPIISPDGRWVAFWAHRAIKKVPLSGGPVEVLADHLLPPFGMTWAPDGTLFYAEEESPIKQLNPSGTISDLTRLASTERSHRLPSVLPGGQAILYTARRRTTTWGDEEVVAHVRATGARKLLLRDAADARYLPSGHLLFLRRGTLFGVGFDPERLEVHGTPMALLDGVAQALLGADSLDLTGAGQFAVSDTGTLAWVPGTVATYPEGTLVTVDRDGHEKPLGAPVRPYVAMTRIAPDGRRVAVPIHTIEESAIWVFDPARDILTKVTQDGEAFWPQWTPDGQRIAFDWLAGGRWTLAWQRVDGSTPPEVLVTSSGRPNDSGHLAPSSWSADGRLLAAVKGEKDIWMVTMEGGRATPRPLLETRFMEKWPEFSPDGRWLAYAEDHSGRLEVYVQPYPGPGPREQVSIDGGIAPSWNPNGRELYFVSGAEFRMMAVDVRHDSPTRLAVGRPRRLFDFDASLNFACYPIRCHDVTADARFLTIRQQRLKFVATTEIHLVQNWLDELSTKVPSGLGR